MDTSARNKRDEQQSFHTIVSSPLVVVRRMIAAGQNHRLDVS